MAWRKSSVNTPGGASIFKRPCSLVSCTSRRMSSVKSSISIIGKTPPALAVKSDDLRGSHGSRGSRPNHKNHANHDRCSVHSSHSSSPHCALHAHSLTHQNHENHENHANHHICPKYLYQQYHYGQFVHSSDYGR